MREKRVRWERAAEWFTWFQSRMGKTVKPLGSLYLLSLVRPEFRREVSDIDVHTPSDYRTDWSRHRELAKTAPVRVDTFSTHEHPLFVILGYLTTPEMPDSVKEKHLKDLSAIYRTYKFLKEKRSPEVAEIYLEELIHPVVEALRRDIHRPEGWRYWSLPPEENVRAVLDQLRQLPAYREMEDRQEFEAFWVNFAKEVVKRFRKTGPT